ncbi:MAG: hypothetical protein HZB43_01340 [candidate division Zixibacteria bacterium]|nr:hypothetical protein [candidate division Zixibacteria bacterium]
MPTFNPRRFTEPGALRRFRRDRLSKFLSPYGEYLAKRGLELPSGTHARIDYDTLSHILMTPNKDTPNELVEALYFVHEMATARMMDTLLAEVKRHHVSLRLGPKPTAADVALELWLCRPDLLQRKHAEQKLEKRRNFESFKGSRAPGNSPHRFSDHAQVSALQADLRAWFEKNLRGSWCKVIPYRDGLRTVYMVRHGDAMHREPSVAEDRPSVAIYRPELFDVLAYNAVPDELWINAEDWIRDEYRRYFGLHLFGNEDYFPPSRRFTLEPLRRSGRASLVCIDVSGIERVHLIEIEYGWTGAFPETVIRKSPDLFTIFEGGHPIPGNATLTGAKFKIQFTDSKKWRTVRVEIPNKAVFQRDDDARLVEVWLRKRGFIVTHRDKGQSHARVLDSTRAAALPVGS